MPALIVPAGLVCGVDEAGRGPLAGPVVAAAVILDPARPIAGLNDSKKLSARKRDALAIEIREKALAWAVAEASLEEIDRLNILHASMLAMQRAVAALPVAPTAALIDGNRFLPSPRDCPASGSSGPRTSRSAQSACSAMQRVVFVIKIFIHGAFRTGAVMVIWRSQNRDCAIFSGSLPEKQESGRLPVRLALRRGGGIG